MTNKDVYKHSERSFNNNNSTTEKLIKEQITIQKTDTKKNKAKEIKTNNKVNFRGEKLRERLTILYMFQIDTR